MNKKKLYNRLITVTSIAIPVVVAILFRVRIPNVEPLDQLPPIYAGINALTAIFLLIALVAIKQGKRKLHERLMKVNILFSLAFLLMYIAYHMTSDPTPYGMVDGVFVSSQTSKTREILFWRCSHCKFAIPTSASFSKQWPMSRLQICNANIWPS